MTAAVLNRTTLRTSRLLDFCSRKELIAQTGHQPDAWPIVVLKELVDNALDACEEAGTAPIISVRVHQGGITVIDNGPGIPAEMIDDVLDFSIRVSSREAYVAPDRGAQGNALQTIIAMPFVLDGRSGCIRVMSRGVRHKITFTVDAIRQEPVVDHQQVTDQFVKNGTVIAIRWPFSSGPILRDAKARFLQFALDYTGLNPHLSLTVDWFGERGEFEATDTEWPKWRPNDPTCPHWYQRQHLERLIAGYITHDADQGRDRTVRELIREFRGLTGSGKQKAVLDATGLARTSLSQLRAGNGLDRDLVCQLLHAMKKHSKPVKPRALGVIGKDHLQRHFEDLDCELDSFEYRKIEGITDGVPWVIEAAFAWCADNVDRTLITGINWSPGIINPFREIGRFGMSLDTVLSQQRVDEDEPVIVFLHLACARVEYTDRGKSAVVIPTGDAGGVIVDVVQRVTEKWAKQRKAEERVEDRRDRRRDALVRQKRIGIKKAAWEVMEEAYMKMSDDGTLPAGARQIMYAARNHIQERAEKELDKGRQTYFTQTLLPDFMNEHPELTADWDVVFDARGHLVEPHTNLSVPLGTLEVREYLHDIGCHTIADLGLRIALPKAFPTHGPKHRYGAIMFIEKEGFWPLFKSVRLADRYDIAIMSTKGLTVTAARQLVDELCAEHDIPLFVLHDFDKAGFSILGTLRRATRRYTFKNEIRVVDLGVRLADVEAYDLASEKVSYHEKNPAKNLLKNGATQAEIDFLVQHRVGERWTGRRVELNSFTSRQLIDWIEAKLAEHGVRKVVPDDDVLAAAYRRVIGTGYIQQHTRDIVEAARRHAAGASIPVDLREEVNQHMALDPTRSWDAIIWNIATSRRDERP